MKIVIAPDSFKGTLSAPEVCNHVRIGIQRALPDAVVETVPMSDGGEGLVEVMVAATGGEVVRATVKDPLGRDIESFFGLLGGGEVAVIEMAAASGLPLLSEDERDPLVTTTFGTGELMKAALDRGVKKILIGIGGSATNDGGTGMAMALGAEFLDGEGQSIGFGGGAIERLAAIRIDGMDPRLRDVTIEVACDVDNPLTGKHGAAHVYGPQKGATPAVVEILDRNLTNLAAVARADLDVDMESTPGSGAAGGLGGGLLAFCGGTLRPGIEIVLDNTGFDEKVRDADLVITGEGKLDPQSLFGKTPIGVSLRAAELGCPTIAIAGCTEGDLSGIYKKNILAYFSLKTVVGPGTDFSDTPVLLEQRAEQVMRTLRVGQSLATEPSSQS